MVADSALLANRRYIDEYSLDEVFTGKLSQHHEF